MVQSGIVSDGGLKGAGKGNKRSFSEKRTRPCYFSFLSYHSHLISVKMFLVANNNGNLLTCITEKSRDRGMVDLVDPGTHNVLKEQLSSLHTNPASSLSGSSCLVSHVEK